MTPEEKKIIGLTAASHGLVHLYDGVLPPLIPLLMADFGTDYLHLGLVVTVFSYAFGIGALPAGFLADKVGPRRLITLFLMGSGVLCAGIMGTGTLLTYGVVMGLVGAFCSTYHPASNTLLSLRIAEKGKAFGIHGIAGSVGTAVVPGLSAWIGSAMGWKAPHVMFGLFGVTVGFYSLTIPKVTETARTLKTATEEQPGKNGISYTDLVLFYLSAMALGLSYKGIMTFLPVYLGQNVNLSFLEFSPVALGGTVATVALLWGAVGQYLAGYFSDRFMPEKLLLGALLMGTVSVFLMAEGNNWLLLISTIFYAFFYFATQPIQNYLITNYLPKRLHGLGFGIHFFLSFGVGSTAAAVCGYLADRFGLQSVFYVMGFCFVAASCLALCLLIRARANRS